MAEDDGLERVRVHAEAVEVDDQTVGGRSGAEECPPVTTALC
ncbi:hypothetical protein [Streptomyces decoyicus]